MSGHRNVQKKLSLLAGKEIGNLDNLSVEDRATYRQALTAYLDRFKLLVHRKLESKRDTHFDTIGFPELVHVKIKTRKASVAASELGSDSPAASSTGDDAAVVDTQVLEDQKNISELEQASLVAY